MKNQECMIQQDAARAPLRDIEERKVHFSRASNLNCASSAATQLPHNSVAIAMDQLQLDELRQLIKVLENNRQLETTLSLQNLCIKCIVDNNGISRYLLKKIVAPPLRTALLEKVPTKASLQPVGTLLPAYRLMAMLVHQSTTFLRFPGCGRKRRLSIEESTELENLAEEIAMGAPAVTRLRFGKNLPYPFRTKLLASDRFLSQWTQMRNLQSLEAFSLTCNSRHLQLIADNMPNLRYLQVKLDLQYAHFNLEGIIALQKLRKLRLFHFAVTGEKVSRSEVQHVSLCLKVLPFLTTVGRYFQHIFCKMYHDLRTLTNRYHDVWGFSCPRIIPFQPPCRIFLQEFFITGDWDQSLATLLPNLKYLHVKNGKRSTYVHIPETVTTLGLYENMRLDGQSMLFPPQLSSLTLQNCNLLEVSSGGILKQCPNLERLYLRHCTLGLSDMVMDPASVNMSRSRLHRVTIEFPHNTIPEGLLSLLLQAPLLSQVEISVRDYPVETTEKMLLVEQIRSGRIMQKVTMGRFYDRSLLEILLAVRAYCPKIVNINDDKFQ